MANFLIYARVWSNICVSKSLQCYLYHNFEKYFLSSTAGTQNSFLRQCWLENGSTAGHIRASVLWCVFLVERIMGQPLFSYQLKKG